MELYFEHTVFYHPELIPGTFCVRAAAAAGRLLMNFLRQKQSELLPVLGCFMPVFVSVILTLLWLQPIPPPPSSAVGVKPLFFLLSFFFFVFFFVFFFFFFFFFYFFSLLTTFKNCEKGRERTAQAAECRGRG